MTTDLFYAILKLVTGEEILAKVCAFIENDEILIVMDNPILVSLINSPSTKNPIVKVYPWMALSTETTHIIRRKDIVTMTEVKDLSIVKVHERYVNQMNSKDSVEPNVKPSSQIIHLDDARKMLEKLYKSQEPHSHPD